MSDKVEIAERWREMYDATKTDQPSFAQCIRELSAAEARVNVLEDALQLFLKYAPQSGDMAILIRASQGGGDEAHIRANEMIEHFDHLNEAHDKARAALGEGEES